MCFGVTSTAPDIRLRCPSQPPVSESFFETLAAIYARTILVSQKSQTTKHQHNQTKMARNSRRRQTDPDVEAGDSVSMTPPRRTSPQEDLSPAGTFDTALTSPDTFDERHPSSNVARNSYTAPPPQKVTIEHNVKSATSGGTRSAGLILGMSKPAMGIAAMLLLGAGGAAAFGWFQIPGLNSQIKELEAQVAALSTEIDRLAEENDRFETLNDELNQTVAEFASLNQDLNNTVTELKDITGDLNSTNSELIERVDELATENANYEQLNNELNATADRLEQEVEFFEVAIGELVLENENLSNLTASLQGVTEQLGNLTTSQNETLTELYTVLNDVSTENDRLEQLTTDLLTVVSYLNDTSLGFGDTLQQITNFIAGQITTNQVFLAIDLEQTYTSKIDNWDCDYQIEFREEVFAQNYDNPISDMPRVLDYFDQRIFNEVCIDVDDFEAFLVNEYPSDVTTNNFERALNNYTAATFDFYFPEEGEEGITLSEWAEASFKCSNLGRRYSWRSIIS